MPQGVGGKPGGGGEYGAQKASGEPENVLLDYMPFVVGALIAAHLLAFAYWIYRVAVEKQPQRRKVS
ncbi:unnamed protein product [Calypogeia fissa]